MKYFKKLLGRWQADDKAIETVEWIMLIAVAMVLLGVIYQFSTWAINQTSDAVKVIEGEKK